MKRLLLIGALLCGVSADVVANQQTSSKPSQAPVATTSFTKDLDDYYDELMPYVGPFSYGFMIGAATGCLGTEIVNPLVAYILKGWGDFIAVCAELGIMGGVGYMVCKDQPSETTTALTKPTTFIGMLAGIIAWYNIHG